MAKKFGVTSANSISSDATTNGTLPKSGLHESLSKFLEKAGEGHDGMVTAACNGDCQCRGESTGGQND